MDTRKNNDIACKNAPVFVVGVDRSGTTLLNVMLDAHPDLHITYEVRAILDYAKKLDSYGDISNSSSRKRLIVDMLNDERIKSSFPWLTIEDIYLDDVVSFSDIIERIYHSALIKYNKKIWGDKDPGYTQNIDVLNRLFPDCKFIHIVRDGRDVAVSLEQKWWGPTTFTKAIQYWERMAISTENMLGMLDEKRYIQVRYEDLVSSPARELSLICNTIGINYSSEMLNYTKSATEISGVKDRITTIHPNINKPPEKDQIYKWRNSLGAPYQSIAHEMAGDALKNFGYESGKTSHLLKPVYKFYDVIKESFLWRLKKLKIKK